MTTITLPSMTPRPAWLSRAHGLVGVDVGTCGVKLAQLQQTSAGWRFHARWQIVNEEAHRLTRESLLQNGLAAQLSQIRQASGMFTGRQAAAALPTPLLTLRCFEFPHGPADEMRLMVEQELAEDTEVAHGGHEFAAWIGVPDRNADRVIAASADHALSLRLAKDLYAARLRTTVLDAAPCALARAAALIDPTQREPVAVLDLGYSLSSFTLVREGQPIYCRTFRGCGLQAVVQAMEERMQLSAVECRHLLGRYGISFASAASAGKAVGLACEGVLNSLVDELLRTLQFVQSQLRLSPQKLWLAGTAGVIPNFAALLEESIQVPTAAWQLPGSDDATDAQYATAAGLSAIAWENQPCT